MTQEMKKIKGIKGFITVMSWLVVKKGCGFNKELRGNEFNPWWLLTQDLIFYEFLWHQNVVRLDGFPMRLVEVQVSWTGHSWISEKKKGRVLSKKVYEDLDIPFVLY